MMEFLSRPGNYLANLQSSYASSGEGQAGAGGSNNLLSGATGLLTNNPLTGALTGAVSGLIGDGSLSRKDFIIELTVWFRRAIWFLGFTAALTASAPLFLTTAALAIVFELVYNLTNARDYW